MTFSSPAPSSASAGAQVSSLAQLCGSKTLLHDRYQILRILGRGGFGVTYLARDAKLPTAPLCVVKQLCPKVNNPEALKRAKSRFWQEAKSLSKLGSHAQIPMLLDYFTLDNDFYLVQEYVRGTTLTREIRRNGPLSEAETQQVLQDTLQILKYIHAQGVIHRDIKPPNILRCHDDGRLVLIDFGAVKDRLAGAESATQQFGSTQFIGTVGFAPPEQIALRPTFASDIYALGVTGLFLMTGKTPLEFEYSPQTGEIDWRSHLWVSESFGQILDRMLKISLSERYSTVDEVLRAFDLMAHMGQLSACLHTHPQGHLLRESVLTEDDQSVDGTHRGNSGYQSPTQRTAAQIRSWRSRLRHRQSSSPATPPTVRSLRPLPTMPL